MEEKDRLDLITRRIIGAAIEVHRRLGPGLLESAYETCLAFELRQMGLKVEAQKPLPVIYRDVKLDCGYRLDLVVEDSVVVEIKAVDLRLSGKRVGLLVNFHVRVLKNGLKRVVNDFPDSARSAASGDKN
jgi:GxxExxY protein